MVTAIIRTSNNIKMELQCAFASPTYGNRFTLGMRTDKSFQEVALLMEDVAEITVRDHLAERTDIYAGPYRPMTINRDPDADQYVIILEKT